MPKEQHYRERAADCLKQANDKTKSEGDRQQLLLMAAEHLKLAQAEAQARLDGETK